MDLATLHQYLDQPAAAEDWLRQWGCARPRAAHASLVRIAERGVTLDLLETICRILERELPRLSDPDMALNNLERFFAAARSPLALGGLFERDPEALSILLQMFSSSQHLSDALATDHEAYDLLRMTEGQPVAREVLVEELNAELASLAEEPAVFDALRRFKRRETLRIAYGDLIKGQRLETVTGQISHLADALVDGALHYARRKVSERRGTPRRPDGGPARLVALGMGKLGGEELNYSSDIDLIFLYDADGKTDGPRSLTNREYFERVVQETVRLLGEATTAGHVYRVDLRLRPEGQHGPLVSSLESALRYYDTLGRTWERQAYVKARPVAGNLDLGTEFLEALEPWIYRRYLGLADITGIKALKRRIERRTEREGHDARDVKTGRGGIRDIEFVIQFLQLLNGGDLPALRTPSTLQAIARLESVGCLTHQERTILEETYAFLRKVEHRLQIMFNLQTHLLPSEAEELRKLAIRLGYAEAPDRPARQAFEHDYQTKTELNRKILDHLLHDAFGDDTQTEPEVDLILDPEPSPQRVREVLEKYRFRDPAQAYRNLSSLARERIRFLSTRRCRHFLAAIAPGLLRAIAATPDPDQTLTNLEAVSDSLGGKGVLWELFSFNAPSMKLYVELCSESPYLTGLMTGNPGMLDELMDSLVLNRLPTRAMMRETLGELVRGAEDLDPILHSFKNGELLAVGVRDILGKESIEATMGALSDIAEVCLEQLALDEYAALVEKLGEPMVAEGQRAGQPARYVILGLGKLGGRELNYHSDLDLVFLYEADGQTQHARRSRRGDSTSNQHFFSELGQRIIKTASRLGPHGRLYEVDPRLRPTGRSGALATTLAEFERYFLEGPGQLWERQALCRARVVCGPPELAAAAREAVETAIFARPWRPLDASTIRDMRRRLEDATGAGNLKRGPGGIVDVEFLVQMLQLRHGADAPQVVRPNTLDSLGALAAAGFLARQDHEILARGYRFLRTIEARLRLMSSAARDDLPEDPTALAHLAHAMDLADGAALRDRVDATRREIRALFDAHFDRASSSA